MKKKMRINNNAAICIISLIFFCFPSILKSSAVHGGTYLAMAGKDSIILAADSRFSTLKSGITVNKCKYPCSMIDIARCI